MMSQSLARPNTILRRSNFTAVCGYAPSPACRSRAAPPTRAASRSTQHRQRQPLHGSLCFQVNRRQCHLWNRIFNPSLPLLLNRHGHRCVVRSVTALFVWQDPGVRVRFGNLSRFFFGAVPPSVRDASSSSRFRFASSNCSCRACKSLSEADKRSADWPLSDKSSIRSADSMSSRAWAISPSNSCIAFCSRWGVRVYQHKRLPTRSSRSDRVRIFDPVS